MLTIEDKIKKFEDLNKAAEEGGGLDRIEKHHAAGKKLHAKEFMIFWIPKLLLR